MITLSDVKIIEEDVKKVKTANATLSCPLVNRFPVTLKVVATYPLYVLCMFCKVQVPIGNIWIQWELF